MTAPVRNIEVTRFSSGQAERKPDLVAVEEPLEIRIGFGSQSNRVQKSLAVTMRTPGQDIELTLGFLFTEGIIQNLDQIESVKHCSDAGQLVNDNIIRAELKPEVAIDFEKLQRHFYTTSSCGVCGKSSIESVRIGCRSVDSDLICASDMMVSLPDRIKLAQPVFEHTGGLHASALFDKDGNLELLREDVGRHNALDKVIGHSLFKSKIPLTHSILLVSGRASFELVQKACMAGIPILAAIGAPSSLAVDLAREMGMTLVGFARAQRFNIYCGHARVAG